MQINSPPPDLLSRIIELHKGGKLIEAEILYKKLLAVYPENADILCLLGTLYYQQKKQEEAIQFLDKAIALNPNHCDAYYNRGLVCYDLKRYSDASENYSKAIALNPNNAASYNNQGNALRQLKRYDEALASYEKAIAINPNYAEAYNNRGRLLFQLQNYSEALASFDRAIAITADYADAQYNKASVKLLLGEYEEGWKLYEWRWKKNNSSARRADDTPLWLGEENLKGKTIVVRAEQGLGDTIQFCRYAQLLEGQGAKVTMEVQRPLVGLLSSLKGSTMITDGGISFSKYDFYCPLMSLPLACKTTLNTIPATVPYLFTDEENLKVWQKRLGTKSKPRIGIVWSGSAMHENDSNRSIPLRMLAPLLQSDFEFHSIQKEVRAEDAEFLTESKIITHEEHLHSFVDTASLVSEMDVIISVDTSVAHLAGALGKKLWLLVYFEPDFRWMAERKDSPWYPTARLFRQPRIDDWVSVIVEVGAELDAIHNSLRN